MTFTIPNASNLASLYFDQDSQKDVIEPYVSDKIEVRLLNGNRGRGLVAKQDIPAGTCLFVTLPALAPNTESVYMQWKEIDIDTSDATKLEESAESCLVDDMMKALHHPSPSVANSFLALVGNSSTENDEDIPTMDRLLGRDETPLSQAASLTTPESMRQIIRRNAFGPDFVTYATMVRNVRRDCSYRPIRILGVYTLAAMLNHSCRPNAVRVYVGECMVVHASSNIPAGQEIVSSYVPPIFPYPQRQSILLQNHGFVCDCSRCLIEAPFWSNPKTSLESLLHLQQDRSGVTNEQQILDAIDLLEKELLPATKPNELQRCVRVGFTELYMRYLNNALKNHGVSNEELLRLCMQLHFGFVSINNASTEHLSILHLGYQLIGVVHTNASDKSKTLPKLRFWTEQVKQACMVRYGNLGHDLDTVRRMMQHTRLILRTPDGMNQTLHPFI